MIHFIIFKLVTVIIDSLFNESQCLWKSVWQDWAIFEGSLIFLQKKRQPLGIFWEWHFVSENCFCYFLGNFCKNIVHLFIRTSVHTVEASQPSRLISPLGYFWSHIGIGMWAMVIEFDPWSEVRILYLQTKVEREHGITLHTHAQSRLNITL